MVDFVASLSTDTIVKAVRYGAGHELPDDLVGAIFDEIANRDVKEALRILDLVIFRNTLSSEAYSMASRVFFSTVL